MKLTPNEDAAAKLLQKKFVEKKVNTESVPRKVWKKILGETTLRIPWKLFGPFSDPVTNNINFTAMFAALGMEDSLMTFVDDDTVQELQEETVKEVNRFVDDDDIDPADMAVDTKESNQIPGPERSADDVIIPKEMVEPESDSFMKRILTPRPRKKKENTVFSVGFTNPIYVVEGIDCSGESSVIGVTKTFDIAFNMKEIALHDAGTIPFEEAEKMIERDSFLMIISNQSTSLKCRITKHELN